MQDLSRAISPLALDARLDEPQTRSCTPPPREHLGGGKELKRNFHIVRNISPKDVRTKVTASPGSDHSRSTSDDENVDEDNGTNDGDDSIFTQNPPL